MTIHTSTTRKIWGFPLILALALGGCVVAPTAPYGYHEEVVIVTPPPRVEYRGYPPATGYLWIDGYWNRVGQRHDWVGGRWAPPSHHHRAAPPRNWERDRDRIHARDRDRDRDRARPPTRDQRRSDAGVRQHRERERAQIQQRERLQIQQRERVQLPQRERVRDGWTQIQQRERAQIQQRERVQQPQRERVRDGWNDVERNAAAASGQPREQSERNAWRERTHDRSTSETRQRGGSPWPTVTR